MRFIGSVLRVYSYIFEAILSLMALAMSAVIVASPHQTIRIGWLPWTPETLGAWLADTGLLGLLFVAMARKIPVLVSLFALAALVLLVRGLFLSSYSFEGVTELQNACYLAAGALLAFVGSIPLPSRSR